MPSSAHLLHVHSFPTRRSSDLTLPLGGARLSRWSAAGKLLWDRMGLEFVSLGNYAKEDPDNFITLQLNRYRLVRQGEPRAEFRGRSEEHTSELQSLRHLVCRLLLTSYMSTLSLHDALPI